MPIEGAQTRVPWRSDGVKVADLEWPRQFDYIGCGLPLLIGITVLAQRGALFHPQAETLLIPVAVAPWLLQLFRRRPPLWLFAGLVLTSVFLVQYVNRDSATALEDLSPFFLVVLCMEMAALMPLRDGLIVLALALGAVGAAEVSVHLATTGGTDLTHALPWYIGVIFGWLGGYLIQSQLRVMSELKAAQVGLAERAAAGERQRMAQELHDVIAHSLTVTMLHITGARKAMQRSSEEAAEALEQAERLGRQSLSDLRRVVGVLGSGASGEHAPMPDAMDVEKLVGDVNAAGAEVDLETKGDLRSIAPTTSLALYRIVQESLTNASKHAPGSPTRVALDVTNGHVSLTVSNRLPEEPISTDATADGLGLWGMSERARVLGGTFAAGPQGDEWVVRVKAPTAVRT